MFRITFPVTVSQEGRALSPTAAHSLLKPDVPSSLGQGPPGSLHGVGMHMTGIFWNVPGLCRHHHVACSSLRTEYLHPGSPWQLEQNVSTSLWSPYFRGMSRDQSNALAHCTPPCPPSCPVAVSSRGSVLLDGSKPTYCA